MAFNRLYKHIEKLIITDDEIGPSVPCKTDILGLRECRKGGKVSVTSLLLVRMIQQY